MTGPDGTTPEPLPTQEVHPDQDDNVGPDVGGPAQALGTGVADALTGNDPMGDDTGDAGTNPQPT